MQAVNENVAVRLNALYESSDTFRDYGHLERYGFNPTVTLIPTDDTKIKLSYEFFHDSRLADRGNPSQRLPGGGATRFNPTAPFAPNGDLSTFFGSPIYNNAKVEVQTGMAVIEHDFGNGLTVRNGSIYADYNRGYQNVYPGGTGAPASAGGGAVTPDQTKGFVERLSELHAARKRLQPDRLCLQNRDRLVLHTVAFGTEFGRQTGLSQRNSGQFPNGALPSPSFVTVNPFNPTYFGPGHVQPYCERCQQQVPAQHQVGVRPGSDRSDALAAISAWRPLRQFRSDRARPEHKYQPQQGRRFYIAARSRDREARG